MIFDRDREQLAERSQVARIDDGDSLGSQCRQDEPLALELDDVQIADEPTQMGRMDRAGGI
jgi:hypothetical protein